MKLGNQLWGIALQPADKIRFIRSQIEFKLLALAAGLDRRSSDTGDRQSRHAFSRRACFLLCALRSCQNCEKRTLRNLIDRAGTFGLGCMSYGLQLVSITVVGTQSLFELFPSRATNPGSRTNCLDEFLADRPNDTQEL